MNLKSASGWKQETKKNDSLLRKIPIEKERKMKERKKIRIEHKPN